MSAGLARSGIREVAQPFLRTKAVSYTHLYYTVVEFDPLYYSSTTVSQRTIWLGSGATYAVNFGDFYSGMSAYLPLLVRATQ